MSKDKKNKATKKRRKWLDILRWVDCCSLGCWFSLDFQ